MRNALRLSLTAAAALILAFLLTAALAAGFEVEEEPTPAEPAVLPEGFVRVREVIPDVIEEMRYALWHNFTGRPVDGYEGNTAILTVRAAEALREAADIFREMGYRVKIYDAYRPQRAVRCFMAWAAGDDESTKVEFYPGVKSKDQLLSQGYIARNSAHMKGSAVDMTLTDMEGTELDMGTCFDFFDPLAWHGAAGITAEQAENRRLLREVMEQCGFRPFEQEWWHYRLIDQPYPDTTFDFPVN